MIIDGIEITAKNFEPTSEELANYVEFVKAREPNVVSINVILCEDGMVNVKYVTHEEKFERIRRITGVG